jgi:diacylglycerol O-acyltransferase / wax synthase
MRRLRPDDDFLLLTEGDATPMHIGSLQYFDVPELARAGFDQMLRNHLAKRLAMTPLLSVLSRAPDDFDSPVWVERATCDLDYHVVRHISADPLTRRDVHAFVEKTTMERLDLTRPPFRMYVFDNLAEGGCAIFVKVHHALVDGVGFQTILQQLTDADPTTNSVATVMRQNEVPPTRDEWMELSKARFENEATTREAWAQRKEEALSALSAIKNGAGPHRAETPTLKLSGATSDQRGYDTLSLSLERMRSVGKRLGGTVNDVFLTMAGGALRAFLLEIDDLPAEPLVINSARSYRRAEHGELGNRIVAMHPHIGTHIEDPNERLRAIQQSMSAEFERSKYDEMLLDAPDIPFGARDRRAAFAKRLATGARVLPGNITLSNVPGPAIPRYLSEFRQLSNFPTPVLGSGRFLNITMRRTADALDLGIMTDRAKIAAVSRITELLAEEFHRIEAITKTG